MDPIIGTALAKIVENIDSKGALDKATGIFEMLFPYIGIEQKALELYIDEISKSNLTAETKVYMVLNAKKTIKKIKNQQQIADIAMHNVSNDNAVSSGKPTVSEEWLDRFMDSAGFVCEEDMQLIWGKILASEIERPGSTPPNMIRVLSEITPELAWTFKRICSMQICMIPLGEDESTAEVYRIICVPFSKHEVEFSELGMSFQALNELDSLGIIKFESVNGYISGQFTDEEIIICVGDNLDLIKQYKKGEIPIGDVLLTKVGEALRAITDTIEIEGYHEMVKEYMISKGVRFAETHEYEARFRDEEVEIIKGHTSDLDI